MINAKIGDTVNIECYTGMGSGGKSKVTKITNEVVGKGIDGSIVKGAKKKKVIWCGSHAFSADTGDALNEPTMYYISHVVK